MSRKQPIPDALEHLRAWRERLDLTRPIVVDRMVELRPERGFIDQATLAKWENGVAQLTISNLFLVAAALGVEPQTLFTPPPPRFVAPERHAAAKQLIPRKRGRRAAAQSEMRR